MVTTPDPFRATADGCATVEALVADGWTRDPGTGAGFELVSPPRPAAAPLLDAAGPLGELCPSVRLHGVFGDMWLRVERRAGGVPVVAEVSPGEPDHHFEGDELGSARAAWDLDADAALALEGEWTATVTVDPTVVLRRERPGTDWRAFRDPDELDRYLASLPWWRSDGLVPDGRAVGVVLWSGPDVSVTAGAVAVASLPAEPRPAGTGAARRSEDAPDGVPSPDALAPSTHADDDISARLASLLWRFAAAAAWAHVASGTAVPDDDTGRAALEFFGYRRTSHRLGPAGPDLDERGCRAAYRLWEWVASDGSPDRLLAVHQVVSLYQQDPPWDRADDVRRAARPLFVALRQAAVAEVLAQQRETRKLGVDVARQSVTAAAGLAREAVGRCLASLLALGAVVVAETNPDLSAGQADSLRTLVAAFLFALAAWNVFVEGPPVSAPLDHLDDDLDLTGPLLDPDERRDIGNMGSVVAARRHARLVRAAVPAVYAATAVVALTAG